MKKMNTISTATEKMIRNAFRTAIIAKGVELLESTATPEEIKEFKELTDMTDNPYQLIWWNITNDDEWEHIPPITSRVDMEELVIWYDGEDGIPYTKLDTELTFDELGRILVLITAAIERIDRENEEFRQFLISLYRKYGKPLI
jgi:hypothetical protein